MSPQKLSVLGAVLSLGLALASPASASMLIDFTDLQPSSGYGFIVNASFDGALRAAWSQTGSSTNVTLSAPIYSETDSPSGPINWWLTTKTGPTATAADVVASGSFAPPGGYVLGDFGALPYVTLATGLDFGPGTYNLVLAPGAAGTYGAWIAEDAAQVSTSLAAGFSLLIPTYSNSAVDPAYQTAFTAQLTAPLGAATVLPFRLESAAVVVSSAPEPDAWALMIMGFAGLGAVLRRRPRTA